jgi:hypothetical protein
MESNVTATSAAPAAEAKAPRRPRRTAQQVVDRDCGQIGKYRVRLVRASDKPDAPRLLDVREWVKGANYEGFTRKGVRLGAAEARALRAILEEVGTML